MGSEKSAGSRILRYLLMWNAIVVAMFAWFYYKYVGWTFEEARMHLTTSYNAFYELSTMPDEHIDEFFKAYELLEKMPTGAPTEEDVQAVRQVYRVLHRICAAGVVMEILLVPPVLDREAGILGNLELWQNRMMDKLGVFRKPGDPEKVLLDTGSGRGVIAKNVALRTGAKVIGVNIDDTQIAHGEWVKKEFGLEDRITYVERDYNLPFDFLEDESVDGHYCAQACSFVNNKTAFMAESKRVLKKGARFYGLELLRIDENYDENNKTHWEIVRRASTIIGGSFVGPRKMWEDAFEANGMKVIWQGHGKPDHWETHVNTIELLEPINAVYAPMQQFFSFLQMFGIMKHGRLPKLFERLRMYWPALQASHHLDLISATYEFIVEKV